MGEVPTRLVSLCAKKLTDTSIGALPVLDSTVIGTKGYTLTYSHLPEICEAFIEFAALYKLKYRAVQANQFGLRVYITVPYGHPLLSGSSAYSCVQILLVLVLSLILSLAVHRVSQDESSLVHILSTWKDFVIQQLQ